MSSSWETVARQLTALETESLQQERKLVAVRSALHAWRRDDAASADRALREIADAVGFHLTDEGGTSDADS